MQGGDGEDERDALYFVKERSVLKPEVHKKNFSILRDNAALKNLSQIRWSIVHLGSRRTIKGCIERTAKWIFSIYVDNLEIASLRN